MAYAWGGSQAVAETAAPLALRYGSWISSRKRPAWHPLSRSNPSSDHNEANRTAYALDYATFNGAPLAHGIARHFGIGGYSTGNYTNYTIQRGGASFRVQILWAVSGHFNHVHLGVRLVGGTFQGTAKRDPLRRLGRRRQAASRLLLYRRRERRREGRDGKGSRYRRLDRAVARSYRKVLGMWRRAKPSPQRDVLAAVLKDRDGKL